ncbi:MAG: hypothetical protein Q8896_10885 [Bacteroidota bacterium]|nr:hypothetical protein [Bacteroidota bacterium]
MKSLAVIAALLSSYCSAEAQTWLSNFCKYVGSGTIGVYQTPPNKLHDFELHGKPRKVYSIDSTLRISTSTDSSDASIPPPPDLPPRMQQLVFDSLGNLIEHFDTSMFQGDHYYYSYDSKGNVLSSVSIGNYSNYRMTWDYDAQSRWKDVTFFSSGSYGTSRSHLSVRWDKDGIPLLEDSSASGVATWVFGKKTAKDGTYALQTLHVDYPFGVAHTQRAYCYFDHHGSLLILRDSNNGVADNTYYFDSTGNIVKSKEANLVEPQYTKYVVTAFNQAGEKITVQEQTLPERDASNKLRSIGYSYQYDSQGNWTVCIEKPVVDPSWMVIHHRTIEY